MALNGKYELVKDEGYLQHLLAMGVPEESAKRFQESSKSFQISIDGNNLTITRSGGFTENLKLDVENTVNAPDGITYKTTPTLKGNQLIITTGGDKPGKRIYELNGSELTLTSSGVGAPDAKRIFKKV